MKTESGKSGFSAVKAVTTHDGRLLIMRSRDIANLSIVDETAPEYRIVFSFF